MSKGMNIHNMSRYLDMANCVCKGSGRNLDQKSGLGPESDMVRRINMILYAVRVIQAFK